MLAHLFRTALRGFRRNKLTTGVQIVSLWIGLVGFIAAYAVAMDFRTFGTRYEGAERIRVITQSVTQDTLAISDAPISGGSIARYLEADLPGLDVVARAPTSPAEHAVAAGDRKAYQRVLFADPGYYLLFPDPLAAPLPFGAGENPLARPRSVLLAPDAAATLFGDSDPVGRSLHLAGAIDVYVAGVFAERPWTQLAEDFDILASYDTRLALQRAASGTDSEQAGEPDQWFPTDLITFVRLPADGTVTAADLDRTLATLPERHIDPEVLEDVQTSLDSIPVSDLLVAAIDMIAGGQLGVPITTLILVVGILILAMACLNYANLAAAQTYARAKHVGLLKVFGAKRGHVFVQSIVEATLIVSAALVLALICAEIAMPLANAAFAMTLDLPYLSSASLWLVLVGLVAGVGIVAGGYPALLLARVRPVMALRAGSQKGGPHGIRQILVGTQFTVASILLILVLVMVTHHRALRAIGADAAGDPVVVISSVLPDGGSARSAFADALAGHPAVESVSATGMAPWSVNSIDVATLSRTPGADGPGLNFLLHDVDYDYFKTMQTDLIAGRVFSRDRAEDRFFWGGSPAESVSRPLHVVIDRDVARRFGWNEPAAAVGQTLHRRWSGFSRPVEIIGVVEKAPYKLVGLGIASSSIYFLQPDDTIMLLARISGDAQAAALAHIDATWDAFAPEIPVRRAFLSEMFDEAFEIFRIFSAIFGGLALIAVFVACMGLFGAATYAAGRRSHEIGVRKSLGAKSGNIVRLLLWSFTKPVLIANLIAWPIAFVVTSAYYSLFVVQTGGSLLPYFGGLAITLAVAWLTVALHTLKASRVRPAEVLRQE